jgi:hypothetical protein
MSNKENGKGNHKGKDKVKIIDPGERTRRSVGEIDESDKKGKTLVIAPGELTERLVEELTKSKEAKTEIIDPGERTRQSLGERRESKEQKERGTLVIAPGELTDRLVRELHESKQKEKSERDADEVRKRTVGTGKLTCVNPATLQLGGAETIVLEEDEITVGRGPDNTVSVVAEGVSRHHARLFPGDGAWGVSDMGSTNGIKVNGKKLEKAWLKSGDQLAIGSVVYEFSLVDED